jgi:hypothetical protein
MNQPDLFEYAGPAVRQEMTRRKGRRDAVAELLSDGEWHSNYKLLSVGGFRYGARIFELRRGNNHTPGVVIHGIDQGEGAWSFRLDSERQLCPGCRCAFCAESAP